MAQDVLAAHLTGLIRESLERRTPSTGQTWRTYTSLARSVTGVSDGEVGERHFRALVEKLVSGAREGTISALFRAHAGPSGRVKLSAFGRAVLAHGDTPLHSFVEAHEERLKAAAEAHGGSHFAHPWDRRARTAAAGPTRQQAAGEGPAGGCRGPAPSEPASPAVQPEFDAGAAPAEPSDSARPGRPSSPTARAAALSELVSALGALRAHLAEIAERNVRMGADPLCVEDRHSLHRGQRDAARQQLALVGALEAAARAGPAGEDARSRPGALASRAPQLDPSSLHAALRAIAAACGVGDGSAPYCAPRVVSQLWAVCVQQEPPHELLPGADARALNLVAFVYPPLAVAPPRMRDGDELFGASAALHRRPPADPTEATALGGGRMADGPFDRSSGRSGARYIPPPPPAELPSSVSYRHCVTSLLCPRDLRGEQVSRSARAPDVSLELQRVYGYNGASKWTRSANVFIVGTPADGAPLAEAGGGGGLQVAYSAAGTVVVLDEGTRVQRFFRGHDDDVSCLARHPSGLKMVSGQGGRSGPFLAVWDAASMRQLGTCGFVQAKRPPRPGVADDELRSVPFYQFAICAAAFEPSEGELLAAVGVDERYHELGVWDWRRGRLRGSTQTISADRPGVCAVHALAWAPQHAHGQRVGAHVLVVVGAVPMPRFLFAEPGALDSGLWTFARAQGAQPEAAKGPPAPSTPRGASAARAGTPRGGAAARPSSAGGGAAGGRGARAVAGRAQLCVAFGPARSAFEGLTLTGSDEGSLYAWDLTRMPPTRKPGAEPKAAAPRCVGFVRGAHEAGSAVSALAGTAAGFVSGGADGLVHVWVLAQPRGADGGAQLVRAQSFSLGVDGSSLPLRAPAPLGAEAQQQRLARLQLPGAREPAAPPPALRPPIRSLDAQAAVVSAAEPGGAPTVAVTKVLVGTVGGEVWSIAGERAERLVAAHAKRVDAVAPHPTESLFASAGWDGRLCLWDAAEPAATPRTCQLPGAATSVCFGQPDGRWLCAGLRNGGLLTLSLASLSPVSHARAGDGTSAASALACSPDGSMLAVAVSRAVDIFRVGPLGEIVGLLSRCRGSSANIRTVDWLKQPHASPGSGGEGRADKWALIQASTAARELLFWHAPTGAKVRARPRRQSADP